MSIFAASHTLLSMKTHNIILLCFAVVSLNACQTIKGIQKDFSSMGDTVGSKVNSLTSKDETTNVASSIVNDGTCPSISVDPQLNSMSEFYDISKPSAGTEVSTLTLKETKSACKVDGEYLEVKIDLSFEGELGPKAKRKADDRPFFAYPYFISVTDNEGKELAKELFAASVTYEPNQEKIALVETIRQRLPLNDDGSSPGYQINIGFQLTEEQLFHNASR